MRDIAFEALPIDKRSIGASEIDKFVAIAALSYYCMTPGYLRIIYDKLVAGLATNRYFFAA